MNITKINSRKCHTAEKLSTLPRVEEVEKQFEMLRNEVFTKGLDIVQAVFALLRTKIGKNAKRGTMRFAIEIGRRFSEYLKQCTRICLCRLKRE